jgi:hypothetical protein
LEDYNPLALAETTAKYEELQKSSEMQIDQLKQELKDVSHIYIYVTQYLQTVDTGA